MLAAIRLCWTHGPRNRTASPIVRTSEFRKIWNRISNRANAEATFQPRLLRDARAARSRYLLPTRQLGLKPTHRERQRDGVGSEPGTDFTLSSPAVDSFRILGAGIMSDRGLEDRTEHIPRSGLGAARGVARAPVRSSPLYNKLRSSSGLSFASARIERNVPGGTSRPWCIGMFTTEPSV